MHNDTVTVFNFYEASTGAVWYPHVISGVHLEIGRGQLMSKYGADIKDSAKLHIRMSYDNGVPFITDSSGKHLPYLPSKEWRKQVNDDLDDTITFGSDDFFMKGAWEGKSPVIDSDYADRLRDGFYAYMNAEKDFVFKITNVDIYESLIPHFEILGA